MKKAFSRRSFLEKSAAFSLTALPAVGFGAIPLSKAKTATMATPLLSSEDKFKTYVRLMGSLQSATVYNWFSGHLWGIVPGEAPKPLTTLQGLAKSNWKVEGEGITKESFDLGFFGNLETGEVLEALKNPYTKETVHPFHFMYGGGSKTVYTPEGIRSGDTLKPYEMHWIESGDQIWMDEYGSLSFESPLQPDQWPKASAGEQMHFGSSTTYIANKNELFDANTSSCGQTFFWTAVNSWEPWLQMGQKDGYVMWRATGRKIFDVAEIPASMKAYVAKVQPNYFDEERPWEGRRSTYTSYMESIKAATKK